MSALSDELLAIQHCDPEDACCCLGEHHEGPCCPGWIHCDSPVEIQRCDACASLPSDEHARVVHAADCGCAWEPRDAAVASLSAS